MSSSKKPGLVNHIKPNGSSIEVVEGGHFDVQTQAVGNQTVQRVQKGKAIPLSGEAGQEASEALNGESWPPGVEVQLRQGKTLRIDCVGICNQFFSMLYV